MFTAHRSYLMLLAAAASVAALVSVGQSAWAESGSGARTGPIVVVVGMQSCCPQEAWAEAEGRAEVELASLKLKVILVDGRATAENKQRKELSSLAESNNAACALRIVRVKNGGGDAIDVWISDRVTGKTTVRRMQVAGGYSADDAVITALRVVELYRASLMELAVPGSPRETPPPPPLIAKIVRETLAPAEKTHRPFSLALGASALGSFNDAGFLAAPALLVGWSPIEPFTLEFGGLYSTSKKIYRGDVSTSLSSAAVRAWAFWNPMTRGYFRPSAGLGTGALFVMTEGDEGRRFAGQYDTATAAYFGGVARLAIVPWDVVRFRLDLAAGRALPEVQINFAGGAPVVIGRPLLELGGAVEVWLP